MDSTGTQRRAHKAAAGVVDDLDDLPANPMGETPEPMGLRRREGRGRGDDR